MRWGAVVAVVGAVLAVGPASAGATSVIYIDGGNVWTARVDGSRQTRVTADGTKTTPPFDANSPKSSFVGPYSNVTADDQGRILVSRRYRDDTGQSESPFWQWRDASWKQLSAPALVKMTYCGFPSVGPMGARLHPSGKWFAFWFICNYGSPSWDMDEYVQVNTPGSLLEGPEWSGVWQPSWYGLRVTASNMADGGIQADDPAAPLVVKLNFNLWIQHVGNDRITRIEPARSGGRAIVEHYDTTVTPVADKLTFVTFSGAPQLGGTTEGCTIPTQGDASSPSWSADGRYVAWSDGGGVKTSAVPANLATPGTCQMTARVISATGNQSSLTPYDWGAAPVSPRLTSLRQSAAVWRAGTSLAAMSARRPPIGTTFSFKLNVAASVTFSFSQKLAGRKVKGRCVSQTKSNAKKPRCTRTVGAGTMTFNAKAGTRTVRFAGRVSRTRKLRPGGYVVSVTAMSASRVRSAASTLSFTIVK